VVAMDTEDRNGDVVVGILVVHTLKPTHMVGWGGAGEKRKKAGCVM